MCGCINTEKKLFAMCIEQRSSTTAKRERCERERREMEAGLCVGGKVEGNAREWREQVHLAAH